MSHYIGINEIRDKIFILTNLSLSGEAIATRYCIGAKKYERSFSDKQYWLQTKSIVSNFCLEIAVKLRNASELLNSNDLDFANEKIITCYIAENLVDRTSSNRDFIYICNKIIHANFFCLGSVGSANYHNDINWWDGHLTLSGTFSGKNTKSWNFFFDIIQWCEAAINFLESAEAQLLKLQSSSEELLLRI